MTRNFALAVAGGLMSLSAALAVAQDSAVLDDLYGRGVHAYFSRDSVTAVKLLAEAIDNGSRDPRAYYFRGLALRNLGREEDAALDFKQGATLEQSGDTTLLVVSKSLERVQGPARMLIEGQRRVARLQTRNDRLAREKARFEDLKTEDEVVVRKPGKRPAAPPAVLPEATDPDASDPFGGETEKPAGTPADTPEPAETPEPSEDAPPPKPTTKPAADPFGDEPAEEPPAKPAKPAKPAVDPFGDDEPADEPPAKPAKPEAAPEDEAAVAPAAAKPGKASRSLFSALGKAVLGEDAAAKPAAKPVVDPANAADPFADDEAPAPPVKPVPVPKKPTPPPVAEDPFK